MPTKMTTPPNADLWLTGREAADRLGLLIPQVRALAKRGEIRERPLPVHRRFCRADVERLEAEQNAMIGTLK